MGSLKTQKERRELLDVCSRQDMKWCFIQLQNLRNIDNSLHDSLQSLSTYIALFVLDLPSPDDIMDGDRSRVGDLGDVVEPLDVIEEGEKTVTWWQD